MKRIDCGRAGVAVLPPGQSWNALGLDAQWRDVVSIIGGGPTPRPVQAQALGDTRILESRRHLIVAAPTNSGKSLLGLLNCRG
jgi:hypothetical protein